VLSELKKAAPTTVTSADSQSRRCGDGRHLQPIGRADDIPAVVRRPGVPQRLCPWAAVRGPAHALFLDRGFTIPSPAILGKIHERLVSDIETFIEANGLEVVRFKRGQSKEEIARPYLQAAAATGSEGVVLVGIAQEKVSGWRGFRKGGPDGHPHFVYSRQSLWVNHYYFYIYFYIGDGRWGPGFIKLCP
jgi:hypothetical protein